MNNNTVGFQKHRAVEYILCYVIWIFVAGATIWLLIQAQINMMTPIRLSGASPAMVTFINDVSLILIGVAALFVIILLEHYLRVGVEKAQFWPRVARAITLVAILLAVVYIAAPILLKVLLGQ